MKSIIVLIGLIAASFLGFGQNYKTEIGVVGGFDTDYALARMEGDRFTGFGWSAGFSVQHNLKKRFSLNYKIMYNQSKLEYWSGWWNEVVFESKKCIVIPILARWTFGQKKLKLTTDVGLQNLIWFYKDELDYYNVLTIGLGGTYSINEQTKIFMEGRLGHYYWYYFEPDTYDTNAQILVGVTYGLGQKK
ncbi:hypothetical protein KFE94_17475 [bacterium SCSIO 12643]|nr:hypothetical protein KFE94_17475 [bacterium SCSIO 12643]